MIAATMFSGIGAPECAMPEWSWIWHAEIEKFPSAVLAQRHPESVNLGDINAEDFCERARRRGRPNVLVFGSPCQDFSVAGQRVGLDGARGNLALVALGIVNELRPEWVVFENVPGLLSSCSGSAEAERALRDRAESGTGQIGETADALEDSDFAAFLALVQQCGYLGCYRITDAQFAGVPQRRRRIFAVFHSGDWRPAAAVLFEPESLRGDNPPSRETGQSIAPTISARPSGGGGLGTDFDLDGGLDEAAVEVEVERRPGFPVREVQGGKRRDVVADMRMVRARTDVSGTITASQARGSADDAERGTLIVDQADGPDGAVSSKWSKGTGGPAGDECYNLVASPISFDCKAGGETNFAVGEQAGALRASHGGGHSAIAFTCKDYGGVAAVDQSPTLRAMEFSATHANGGGQIAVAFQMRVARNGRGAESDGVPALNGADAGATSDMRPCVAIFKPSHFTRGKDGAPSEVSPPLGAEPDKGDQDPVLMDGVAVRRLTPRECERLQAFEDDYTLVKFRGKLAADGPRYKALGNAMNVNEVRAVLRRIDLFEKTVRV